MATEVVSPWGRRPGRAGWDLALGAAIGYCASRVMDLATTWYRERQGEASRRREDEVAPGGGLVLAGRALAEAVGRAVTDQEAARIGLVVHRSLGVSYGMAAAALVRRGIGPLRAGLIAGTAAFLLVDEGVNSAFSPRRRRRIPSRATCGGSSGTSPTASSPARCSPRRGGWE